MNNKKEIIVGRQGDLLINNPTVSRKHAKVIRADEGLYLEDLDSSGGTYVNGKQIKKKLLKPTDSIKLADYTISYKQLEQAFPLTDEEFSRKFLALKDVYDAYNRNRLKIQSQNQGKVMLKRTIPMAIPGVLMMIARDVMPSLLVIGGVLSAAAIVGGVIWSAQEQKQGPQKLHELEEQFKVDYTCPSCHSYFGSQQSWQLLQKMGKCPRCNRVHNL